MTTIALSRIHFPVTTLGPGQRIGVWFQGCSIRCEGCISPDTWDASLSKTVVSDVLAAVGKWAPFADGLTVSGGEPLDQPDALLALLEAWRQLSDKSVLLFTGREWPLVPAWLLGSSPLVDAVIAGPFDRHSAQTLALRGSDNQSLHFPTEKGWTEFASFERETNPSDRRLDVMFDETGGVWFAGIPARDDFIRLRQALRGAGAQVTSHGPMVDQ
jgi:anaerobic ribonucleoside-triphosphate reductase activating protein